MIVKVRVTGVFYNIGVQAPPDRWFLTKVVHAVCHGKSSRKNVFNRRFSEVCDISAKPHEQNLL